MHLLTPFLFIPHPPSQPLPFPYLLCSATHVLSLPELTIPSQLNGVDESSKATDDVIEELKRVIKPNGRIVLAPADEGGEVGQALRAKEVFAVNEHKHGGDE